LLCTDIIYRWICGSKFLHSIWWKVRYPFYHLLQRTLSLTRIHGYDHYSLLMRRWDWFSDLLFWGNSLWRFWWLSALYTSLLFPGVILIGGFLLNFIAWGYGSLTAIPFATVIIVWIFRHCNTHTHTHTHTHTYRHTHRHTHTFSLWLAFSLSLSFFLYFLFLFFSILNYFLNSTFDWCCDLFIQMLGLWFGVTLPLTFIGAAAGAFLNGTPNFPCRINPVPRPLNTHDKFWYLRNFDFIFTNNESFISFVLHPPQWSIIRCCLWCLRYQHRWVHVILTGILPFASIFVEMYFVFTAFWQHKYYYVFGFMMLVFLILIMVTVCVTIVSTYFLLNSEDYRLSFFSSIVRDKIYCFHSLYLYFSLFFLCELTFWFDFNLIEIDRWHWTSFLSAASTGVYVYLYAIYYFHRSRMSGFLQTMYFFGYSALFCFGLSVLCGTCLNSQSCFSIVLSTDSLILSSFQERSVIWDLTFL
jgi:hypothetical protein